MSGYYDEKQINPKADEMKTITNQPDRDCRAALAVTNSVIARSEMTRQSMVAMDPRVKPEDDEMPSFRT